MKDQADLRLYLIFLHNQPPQQLMSSRDLVKDYLDQLKERAKKGDWWWPIQFTEDDGRVSCAYPAYGIAGVVQGGLVPKEEAEHV
jgi:hypothetical protein